MVAEKHDSRTFGGQVRLLLHSLFTLSVGTVLHIVQYSTFRDLSEYGIAKIAAPYESQPSAVARSSGLELLICTLARASLYIPTSPSPPTVFPILFADFTTAVLLHLGIFGHLLFESAHDRSDVLGRKLALCRVDDSVVLEIGLSVGNGGRVP